MNLNTTQCVGVYCPDGIRYIQAFEISSTYWKPWYQHKSLPIVMNNPLDHLINDNNLHDLWGVTGFPGW